MSLTPVATDRSPQWHVDKLADFTALKAQLGEPSPHMTMVGAMSQGCDRDELVWRAGCYLNPYSVATAEVTWTEWPLERYRAEPKAYEAWLRDNWAGIHTRTERRCVRGIEQFLRAVVGYERWAREDLPALMDSEWTRPELRYDAFYGSVMATVPFFGRYITIRLLEFLNRYAGSDTPLYDIRSIGGWSPVRALTLFAPDSTDALLSGDKAETEAVAERVKQEIEAAGTPMSYYVFAAMLCEYREAYEDGHQYPGRTIDQELDYSRGEKLAYWGDRPSAIWDTRQALFPNVALGELQGWRGIRPELSHMLRDTGLNWSDLRYDYLATIDTAHPVAR